MKFVYFSIPIYIFIFLVSPARAANVGDVVINEIAWMGSPPQGEETTRQAANDEWLELYNTSGSEIDITGWILKSTDGNPSIKLSGKISARSYLLLSRANEKVENIPSDIVYPYKSNALSNSGEHLELTDSIGNVIDNINAFGSWFTGDNTSKQTMERKSPTLSGSDPASWNTSASPGGTPRTQNSAYQPEQSSPPPPPVESLLPTTTQPPPLTQPDSTLESIATSTIDSSTSTALELSQLPIYPANIFINEVMPYPLGPDALQEWVELINESDKPANISGWKIKDTLGAINIYTFPKNIVLSANSYLVLSRPTTKITMNNDNDAIQLVRPDGELIQTVTYKKAPKGKSYVRVSGVWDWSSVPTPGSANILPIPLKETGTLKNVVAAVNKYKKASKVPPKNPSERSMEITSTTTSEEKIIPSKNIASLSQANPKNSNLTATVFGAFAIAFFSAIFIFLLKRRLIKS